MSLVPILSFPASLVEMVFDREQNRKQKEKSLIISLDSELMIGFPVVLATVSVGRSMEEEMLVRMPWICPFFIG